MITAIARGRSSAVNNTGRTAAVRGLARGGSGDRPPRGLAGQQHADAGPSGKLLQPGESLVEPAAAEIQQG
jgi:hypothetical protein